MCSSQDEVKVGGSTSPTGTASARTQFCSDAPTGFRSPLRPTGIRSNRRCATRLPPTPSASTSIPDDLRPQLAEASQLTESLRLYDSSYHAELEWWTAAFEVSEGIPHSSLVSAAESDRVDVGRTFPVTHHRERRPEVDEDHAKVAVLSTYDDSAQCAALR